MESSFTPEIEHQKFPCRECGAFLVFAPGSTHLKCPYCGTENEIEASAEEIEEIDYNSFIASGALIADKQQIAVIKCTSCGAESSLKPNITSDECPFCGTALVVSSGSLCSVIKPKSLLPFKIDQKQGFGLYKSWLHDLWFAPNDLKKYAHNHEKLNGMYIPYWTYDCKTVSRYTGERGDNYTVTETYTTTENGKQVTRTRQVVKIRWRPASGTVRNTFDDVLVLASHSLPGNYTRELEPWDTQNLVPFNEKYLSGFRTETYQVDVKSGFEQAREIMDSTIRATICRDIGGDHQRIHFVDTIYKDITFKHILLPIWLSAYRYNNKVYRFMVNGRTGEVQGERPYSWIKITLAVLAFILLVCLILFLTEGKKVSMHEWATYPEFVFAILPWDIGCVLRV
jgi:LSD1 subclass zinc finger protein